MVRILAVSLLLAAGLAHAQVTTVVLPASHGLVEGTGTTNVPFGRSGATRVQMVYDGMLFPRAGSIRQLAFRLDGGSTAAPKQVECEIRMSTMPAPLVAMSPAFAGNRGADEAVVLPRQVITLGGDNAAVTPNAFLSPIVLTTPFVYDPTNGPLVVEIVVHAQPPGVYGLDTTWLCTSPDQPFGPAACLRPSNLPLRVESSTTQLIWGRPWVIRVLDAPAGALTTLILGTTESGSAGGWTLPFELGPLGAPGCWLSTDPAGTFFQVAQGDGSAAYTFQVPNVPAGLGFWFRYQAGALEAAANPLGLVTSEARKTQVCGWEPVGRVWAGGTAATVGQWEIGVAPVVQVAIQ